VSAAHIGMHPPHSTRGCSASRLLAICASLCLQPSSATYFFFSASSLFVHPHLLTSCSPPQLHGRTLSAVHHSSSLHGHARGPLPLVPACTSHEPSGRAIIRSGTKGPSRFTTICVCVGALSLTAASDRATVAVSSGKEALQGIQACGVVASCG
jgi:hypothetical protein